MRAGNPFIRAISALFIGAIVAGAVACGGAGAQVGRFSTDWQDDRGVSIGHVWDQTANAPIAPAADVVVGLTSRGGRLVGLPLASRKTWSFAHPLDARPVVAGALVVASGGGDVFALDASDGHLVWKTPSDGCPLIGAGDDGTVTVATLQRPGGAGSVLLAIERSGHVLRRVPTERALGIPAVVGHKAFLPWAGQYVSVLDVSTGEEQARVTLREHNSRAWTEGGALWFGELGFTRFDEHIRDASTGRASKVDLPTRILPGEPKLAARGAVPLPTVANANDRVRLVARPTDRGTPVALADDRFYATYFRLAMAFEAKGARLAWVHLQDGDLLGGAAGSGAVVFCDDKGAVTTLDALSGSVLSVENLGEPLDACVVNVDGWRFDGEMPAAKPLAEQLREAVTAPDAQLVAAQKLLLAEVAAMPDASATTTLLGVATDARMAPDLVKDARASLAKRPNGGAEMLAALRRHYDYLHDVLLEPPVGAIAEALSHLHEQGAAPVLAAHLLDPENSSEDIMQVGAALNVLAGPAEAPALRQFFAMYRATADSDDLFAAVVSVGEKLLALEDKLGTEEVKAAAADPMTVGTIREGLNAKLESR